MPNTFILAGEDLDMGDAVCVKGGVAYLSAPRARCLCGKARYATEGEARRAVKRMKSNGRNHSYAGMLHPYMCPERKGIWHVGHTDE
jgi:hypothetical protein